jgi:hypothetical protein
VSPIRLSKPSRTLLAGAAAVAGVTVLLALRLDLLQQRTLEAPAGESAPLIARDTVRLLALGYTDFGADLAWIQALLYYGSAWVYGSDMGYLDDHIETTILLDPSFRRVYQWAGVATMYNAAHITNRAVMASTHFLARGRERFPDYWEFPFMIGCNYYFELQTKSPEQKKSWQRIGAEYFRAASLLPGAPDWVGMLAISSLDKFAERKLAVLHLQELLDQTEDPKMRRELEARLMRLEATADARSRLRADAVLRRAHRRDYPYLPGALYELLGGPGDGRDRTVRDAWDEVTGPAAGPTEGDL